MAGAVQRQLHTRRISVSEEESAAADQRSFHADEDANGGGSSSGGTGSREGAIPLLVLAHLGSSMQSQIAEIVKRAGRRPIRLSLAPVQEGEVHLGVQLALSDVEIECSLRGTLRGLQVQPSLAEQALLRHGADKTGERLVCSAGQF